MPYKAKQNKQTQPHIYIIKILLYITYLKYIYFFFFFSGFLGPHLWHMEVSRLGVKSELQLPAYTTATATQDPSHICKLHHSSRQCRILNPLSEARYRTRVLMVPSWLRFLCGMTGTPHLLFLKVLFVFPFLTYCFSSLLLPNKLPQI